MATNALTLQTNVPELIALQFREGLPVEGNFGPRVMFTLVDGRKLYTPPIVQELITQAGITKGTEFTICKREVKEGGKGKINWEVTLNPPAEATPGAATSPEICRQAAQRAGNSQEPITSLDSHIASVNPSTNGHGRLPDAPYSHTGWAAHLRDQATSLIDVAASCHRYASEKYPGMLRPEDVSDLLTTVYIGMQKGSR